jgi:hypothetical protein
MEQTVRPPAKFSSGGTLLYVLTFTFVSDNSEPEVDKVMSKRFAHFVNTRKLVDVV